jgi:hypothetical protein
MNSLKNSLMELVAEMISSQEEVIATEPLVDTLGSLILEAEGSIRQRLMELVSSLIRVEEVYPFEVVDFLGQLIVELN